MRARIILAGIAVLLPMPPASAAPRTYTVEIAAMKFGPVPAGLHAGDRIFWTNKDIFRHTATANDKSFEVDLPPGAKKSMVVTRPGTISVHCRYHPTMRTVLKVSA